MNPSSLPRFPRCALRTVDFEEHDLQPLHIALTLKSS